MGVRRPQRRFQAQRGPKSLCVQLKMAWGSRSGREGRGSARGQVGGLLGPSCLSLHLLKGGSEASARRRPRRASELVQWGARGSWDAGGAPCPWAAFSVSRDGPRPWAWGRRVGGPRLCRGCGCACVRASVSVLMLPSVPLSVCLCPHLSLGLFLAPPRPPPQLTCG